MPPDGPVGAQPETPVCVRHPDRPTRLRCTRCDRPACPDCLRDASVGMQCVDCVNEGARSVRRPRTLAGAEISNGRPIITQVMIALNVLAYVVTVVQSGSPMNNSRAGVFTATSMMSLIPTGTSPVQSIGEASENTECSGRGAVLGSMGDTMNGRRDRRIGQVPYAAQKAGSARSRIRYKRWGASTRPCRYAYAVASARPRTPSLR